MLIGLALAGYFYRHQLSEIGYSLTGESVTAYARLRADNQRLESRVKSLEAEILEVSGQRTFDQRSRNIDRQACAAMKTTVSDLESELAQCREKLVFYRGIVSPEQDRAGVHVLKIGVEQAGEQLWHYDLVLIQPTRRDRTAKGRYTISVQGILDKRMKSIEFKELQPSVGDRNRFEFRSYQVFEGVLNLPSGFQPARLSVTLTVEARRGKSTKVTEAYDWSELVSQSKEP